MKVALVSDCYPPRLGGIEVQVADLAGQLGRHGHTVRVLTATPGPCEREGPTEVLRLTPPVPLPVPINPWAGSGLRRVLAGADVVHVHLGVLAPFAAAGARIAVRLRRPLVLTWHSMVGTGPVTRVVAAQWRSWVRAGAVPTAVSTQAAGELALVLGVDAVRVLPNGVHRAAWASAQAPLARPGGDGPRRVITAMRFALRKRPLQVVRLVDRVREGLPASDRPHLEIAGDGPWREATVALVRHTGRSSWVDLPGRVSRPELAERYRRSDLYLAPSRKEAFGLAALEAGSAGLPVAGYARTGVADIVRDGAGVLAEDDADLVARLRDLLGSPGALEQMRGRAVASAHEPSPYDWESVARSTEAVYQRARRG